MFVFLQGEGGLSHCLILLYVGRVNLFNPEKTRFQFIFIIIINISAFLETGLALPTAE